MSDANTGVPQAMASTVARSKPSWLLHHSPPPPQPWWLQEMSQVVMQLNLSARMEGGVGGAIQHAALGLLKEQMGQLNAQKAQQQQTR